MRTLYAAPITTTATARSCYHWCMARTLIQSVAESVVRRAERVSRIRRAARHPVTVRTGYLVATAVGLIWGAALSTGRLQRRRGVIVASGCPWWAFGRGGTTIGAVYLTADNVGDDVLDHEAVHRAQWRRYGLAFAVLYLAAGPVATENRFEVEAGLERGGYR